MDHFEHCYIFEGQLCSCGAAEAQTREAENRRRLEGFTTDGDAWRP